MLHRVSDLGTGTSNLRTLLRRILREAVGLVGAASATLSFIDDADECLTVAEGWNVDARAARAIRLAPGQGITGAAARAGRPVRVDDTSADARYVELKKGTRSELAAPMKAEGRVIGVVNVESPRPAAFDAEDERLLAALAGQAAKAIHASRQAEGLARQSARLEALLSASQALVSPDPLPVVLERIAAAVRELMGVGQCGVMLLNEGRELELGASAGGAGSAGGWRPSGGGGGPGAGAGAASGGLAGASGDVRARHSPMRVYEVSKAKAVPGGAPARKGRKGAAAAAGPGGLLSVPVFFQGGLIGMLNLYSRAERRFSADEMRLLEAFAGLCGAAIENARRYERTVRAEAAIRQSDRLATLGALSAELAHEIRNPVTVLKMLLHSLREENAVDPSRARDLEVMGEKLERIDRTVGQVLGFGRRQRVRLEWVDLNTALRDLLFLTRHAAAENRVIVRESLADGLPAVLGDRGHFDQVFLNLMTNALDAMPSGGALRVKTALATAAEARAAADDARRARERAGAGNGPAANDETHDAPARSDAERWVVVSFRDTGGGIDPELAARLFSPFVTGRADGVGLGLFVSAKLLAQAGGFIRLKSTPARGTTVTVTMPVEHDTAPPPEPVPPAAAPESAREAAPPKPAVGKPAARKPVR